LFVRETFLFALFSALTATVTATRLDACGQQCIQPIDSIFLQGRKDMGVGVKGQADLAVAEQFLDNFGMDFPMRAVNLPRCVWDHESE